MPSIYKNVLSLVYVLFELATKIHSHRYFCDELLSFTPPPPPPQLLQQGTSRSSDVRRRQVTRLINRQDAGKSSSSSRNVDRQHVSDPSTVDPHSSIASLVGEEDVHRSSNGTPPSLKRSGSNMIGDLMLR